MKSELGKALENVELAEKPDGFLAVHLLAGGHELAELDAEIVKLTERRAEVFHARKEIEFELMSRHTSGKNYVMEGSVLRIPKMDGVTARRIEIEKVEALETA